MSRRDATPCALLQKEASQRQQRRSVAPASQRRSANSVAASQRQQRRSVTGPTAASQRRSANSVAASLQRRSVAASQRQQRRSVTGPTAASQRRSVAASQRHPPPGASQRNVGNPRFGPLCPCTAKFYEVLFT